MAVETFSISVPFGEVAWARVPATNPDRPARNTHSCDQHGRMERVDPSALEIEKNGVVWEVDGNAPMEDSDVVELHYCPACVDEELRTYDRSEADDLELLTEAIADEWTHKFRRGQMDGTLFSVREVTDEATPEFCPYCSGDLEPVSETTYECSIHGALDLAAEPIMETTPR